MRNAGQPGPLERQGGRAGAGVTAKGLYSTVYVLSLSSVCFICPGCREVWHCKCNDWVCGFLGGLYVYVRACGNEFPPWRTIKSYLKPKYSLVHLSSVQYCEKGIISVTHLLVGLGN